jgi:hypothetical protein
MAVERFAFEFDRRFRLPLALLGIRPSSACVLVDADELVVRFGPWRLRTPRSNILDARLTGPYRWWKTIGPHLSLRDCGVTFGTTPNIGVCLTFTTPVPGIAPFGRVRHPGATVTIAEPHRLLAALGFGPAPR